MKSLILSVMAALLLGVSAFAQSTLVQEKTYESFTKISVEDNFVLRFIKDNSYAVSLKTDERIAEHVQAYVKNGTLYLSLNKKGYTKQLKKQLKKKGTSEPTLEAHIYMPSFSSLVLKDKSTLSFCDSFETETFVITASDNAHVSNLDIACGTAEFNISKNAEVTGTMSVTSKLYLNVSNSAMVSITQRGGNAFISQSNSAYIDFKARLNMIEVESSGGSESHISGTSSLLKITGSGLSKVDADLLESNDGEVILTSSAKCDVNVTDHLKVNIIGGSMLTFKRKPMFEIERVVNSTLINADEKKRK